MNLFNSTPINFGNLAIPTGIALTVLGIVIIIIIAVYVFLAIALRTIARKTGTQGGWRAWVPIVSLFLELEIAELSYWWALFVIVPFLIGVGAGLSHNTSLIASFKTVSNFYQVVEFAVTAYIWSRIARRRGFSPWLGLLSLVPIANYVLYGVLAFSESGKATLGATTTAPSSSSTGWRHPEMKDSEAFLGNYTQEDFDKKITWKTKRMGGVAYDVFGNPLGQTNYHPIFVEKSELTTAGIHA